MSSTFNQPCPTSPYSLNDSDPNRYAEFTADNQEEPKTPIDETLVNSTNVVANRIWLMTGVSSLLSGLGFLGLRICDSPVTGPNATATSLSLLALAVLSTTFAGIGIFSASVLKFMSIGQGKTIEAMRRGQYLARWDLSETQWEQFIEDEKERSSEIVWKTVFVCMIVATVFAGCAWALLEMTGFVLVMSTSFIASYGLGVLIRQYRSRHLEKLASAPQLIVIGEEGLYHMNSYSPYFAFGTGLSSIEKKKTNTMSYLVFTFYSEGKHGRNYKEKYVPVPKGKESEAKVIVSEME